MPVSLQVALQEVLNVGGSPIDSVNAAASITMWSDFSGKLSFTIAKGANPSNSFVASSRSASIQVDVNILTGTWQSSNGLGGTLGAGALNTLQGQMRAFRNQLESFSSNNVFPGSSTVAWT